MADLNDPYHELLGIPLQEQPPNHYRLLGITLFETNRQVIANAALKQSKFLRSLGTSQYGEICQTLLNEVAAAKICLLHTEKKAGYDQQLRARSQGAGREFDLPIARKKTETPVAPKPAPSPAVTSPAVTGPAVTGPAAGGASAVAFREWIIGWERTCDLVVDSPTVSAIHCRLTETADGQFWLEDLHSRNGTYVNRLPITGKVPVTRYHRITLGKKTPMPWPDAAAKHAGGS